MFSKFAAQAPDLGDISNRRAIRRDGYAYCAIVNVDIETAGTIDLDVECQCSLGGTHFSIDVREAFSTISGTYAHA